MTGRVVVITGATGGIGRAVAAAFAAAGARVHALDRDPTEVGALLMDLPHRELHTGAGVDLSNIGEHSRLLEDVVTLHGRIDCLAHLAAVLRRRASIYSVTEEDWDVQMTVNVKTTFFLNRAIAEIFQRQGDGGSIINFASQGWWTGGFGGSVVYNAGKGAIVTMSRGLARTLAPSRIRVNTVAPGGVDTAMMRSGQTDAELAQFVSMIPMARLAVPEELAGIVVFLASDHARYITGATINVSGGQLMY